MRLPELQQRTLRAAWLGTLFILMVVIAGVSSAAAATPLPRAGQSDGHRDDLRQVLSVVEHRTMDGKVREKMRKKLAAMDDRQLRVAASLCEQIARDDDSPGATIAFSIVTAIIVLS
jgi:hypothetical protein